MNLPATFHDKTVTNPTCILWVGATNSRGYGCYAIDGVTHLAHRVAFEALFGPIPDAMTVDHLCRVKQCVNPDHMELVTSAENVRRAKRLNVGDTCSRGHHIADEADLYENPRGRRECRQCRKSQYRAAKARAS